MNKENLKSLHTTLVNEGYTPPAFEQFAKDMEDEKNLQGVYQTLKNEGYTPPAYEQFKADMGWQPAAAQPRSAGGGVFDAIKGVSAKARRQAASRAKSATLSPSTGTSRTRQTGNTASAAQTSQPGLSVFGLTKGAIAKVKQQAADEKRKKNEGRFLGRILNKVEDAKAEAQERAKVARHRERENNFLGRVINKVTDSVDEAKRDYTQQQLIDAIGNAKTPEEADMLLGLARGSMAMRQQSNDAHQRMENMRKASRGEGGYRYNPQTGRSERTYYTMTGEEVNSPLTQRRINKAREEEWEATTDEGREEFVSKLLDGHGINNATETAWEQASTNTQAAMEQHNREIWDSYSGGREARMMATGEMYASNLADYLTYHDLQRMADDAWNNLGKMNQQEIVNAIYNRLKKYYPEASEGELRNTASAMARQQSDRRMYELAVEKNAPSSATEMFFRKALGANLILNLFKAGARAKAGTTGDMAAREDAEARYEKSGHKVASIAGTVAGFMADPLMWMTGGIGSAAAKGATWLGGKAVGKVAINSFAGRLFTGAAASAASLGTFMGASEGVEQLKWGGYRDPETGEVGDYSPWEIAKSTLRGAGLGLLTGAFGTTLGNISDKAVRATESTAGKVALRVGELGVGTVAEGTIFSIPEWISGDMDAMDVWTENMAMMIGFKGQHLFKSAPRVIAELSKVRNPQTMAERNQNRIGFEGRLRQALDGRRPDLALTKDEKAELERGGYTDLKVLTEDYERYQKQYKPKKDENPITDPSKVLGDKLPEGLTYDLPYNRFAELISDTSISEAARAKMYYYLTGRQLPMSTVMGASDVAEVRDANGNVTGYNVQSYGANGVITSRTFSSRKAAEAEQRRIYRQVELNGIDIGEQHNDHMADQKRMEEACRVFGEKVGAPTNTLYEMMKKRPEQMSDIERQWAEQIIKAYNELGNDFQYHQSYGKETNGNGVISESIERVRTSEKLRADILEQYGVDIDKTIKKEPGNRSKKEEFALEDYIKAIYSDVELKREQANARASEESNGRTGEQPNTDIAGLLSSGVDDGPTRGMSESQRRGYHADERGRRDIAIALSENPDEHEAQAAWAGVQQRIEEEADYMAAQDREVANRLRHADGQFHPVTLSEQDENGMDKQAYLIDGTVNMTTDGTMVDASTSDTTVVIYDPLTGGPRQIPPTSIKAMGEVITAEDYDSNIERSREQYVQSRMDAAQGVITVSPGERVTMPEGDEALVVAIDDTGENVTVLRDDGSQVNVTRDELQRVADEVALADYRQRHGDGNDVAAQGTDAGEQEPVSNGEVVAGVPAEYVAGMEIIVRDDDGTEKPAMVMGMMRMDNGQLVPDPDGRIVEYLMDNDVQHTHIDQLNEKVVGYIGSNAQFTMDNAQSEMDNAQSMDNAKFTIHNAQSDGDNAQSEMDNVPEPEVIDANAMPMVEVDGKLKPDFFSATPERSHEYIYNEKGYSKEIANQFVENNIKAEQDAIKKLDKKEPKMGTDMDEYDEKHAVWQEQKDAAQGRLDYWGQVREIQKAIEQAEKSRADAERAARDEETYQQALKDEADYQAEQVAKQQEQAARGANAVGDAIREKWEQSPKVVGFDNEITLANGERIKGKYVLVESGAVTPSHDANHEFVKNEGFPVDENGNTVNDRDYERDKGAQEITRDTANHYDARAIQNVPVVSNDGVVLSGNGRTMAGELAAEQGTDGAYVEHLTKYGRQFGFAPEQVSAMQHPRVVFVPDEALPYTTETFAKFNAQEMKGQNKTEQAVKLGKVVDDATFHRIINSINEFDALGDFYADRKASLGAINELRDAGVINAMQYGEMFDGEKLSDAGRNMIENMLIGKAFESNPDAIRQLTKYKSLRQSVVNALAEISNNVGLGEEYSLESELAEAIKLAYEARNAGRKSGEKVSAYARQMNLFAFDNGETVADYTNLTILMLADVLNDNRVNQLKKTLAMYNKEAQDNADGQMDIFSGGVKNKEDILNEILELLNYGTKEEQQAAVAEAVERRKAEAQPTGSAGVQQDGVAVGSGSGNTGAERSGGSEKETPSLTHDEAISLIAEMEERAELAPDIELTIENWDAQFGEDGRVATPIGEVKMGENQFTKLMRQGREGKLGMIKPTLESPDVIIEDASEAKNGETAERKSSYVFVKAFKKADGSRYYYFTSITVSKDGKEVVVSSQEKSRNRLLRLMTEGKILWRTPKDATTASVEQQGLDYAQPSKTETATKGSGMTPQSIDMSPSGGKVSAKDSDLQGKVEKNETSEPTNSRTDVDSNQSGMSDDTATRQSSDVSVGKGSEEDSSVQEKDEKNAGGEDMLSGRPIQGLEGRSEADVLSRVRGHIEEVLSSEGGVGVTLKGMALHGSRMRGDAREDSDLDVVVEYSGDMREDDLFNLLHDAPMEIDGVTVDINPIKEGKSGTLERYMERSRQHDVLREAEAATNTEPTEAQKEAGNYKKGHVKIDGYDVTIENPKGSIRRGTDASGKQWEQEMQNTYGYIRGTEGVDGDHIDVFFSEDPSQGDVFVVDQVNKDGSFDEHKVMYGFPDIESARKAYLSNYEDGWQGLGAITPVSKEEFKKWIDSSHRKTKPFAEYSSVKPLGDTQLGEQPTAGYSIEPTTYTNKKGKTTPMHLVTFGRELSKDEIRAGKELAKESRGWWDREKGGFMMRDEDSAKALAEALSNEEAVQDAQPLSVEDVATVTDQADMKAVDETIKVEQEPQTTPQYDYDREDDVYDKTLTGLRNVLNDRKRGAIPNIKSIENVIRDLRKRAKTIEDGMATAAGETIPQAFDALANLNGRRKAYEQFLVDIRKRMAEDERDDTLAAHGVKLGDKVKIRGKEATIHDADARQVTLDTGMAPVLYEVTDWENVEVPKREPATPQPKKVNVESLMGELNEKGEAKLSDHTEEQQQEESTEQPKQEEKKAKSKWVDDADAERFEELRRRLRQKLGGQLNMGVDPEAFALGVEMSYLMLKHGARKFAEFAKQMIEALGENVRPYLKSFYNGARDLPEMAEYEKELTPYDEVRTFDVMNFDKEGAKDIVATAEHIVREQAAEREAKEATDKLKQERNEQRKETEQEVAANTEALASEAATVASEVESKLPSARSEREVNDLAKNIDDAIDKVNDQLALLGYYEAEPVESDFNEAYGYMRNAEKKAVKNVTELFKTLTKELGISDPVVYDTKGKKQKSVTANIAPAGGDVTMRFMLNRDKGVELYIDFMLEPDYENNRDNLVLKGIMFRPERNLPNGGRDYLRANNFFPVDVTMPQMLQGIRSVCQEWLPAEDYVAMAQRIAAENAGNQQEKPSKERKSKKKSVSLQEQTIPDLFSGLFSEDNLKNESNDTARTRQAENGSREDGTVGRVPAGRDRVLDTNGTEQTDNGRTASVSDTSGSVVDATRTGIPGQRSSRSATRGNNVAGETERGLSDGGRSISDGTVTDGGNEDRGTSDATVSVQSRAGEADRGGKRGLAQHGGRGNVKRPKQTEPKFKRNYIYPENSSEIDNMTPQQRLTANVEALEVVRTLMKEGREATPEEREILGKYRGWGGVELGRAYSTDMMRRSFTDRWGAPTEQGKLLGRLADVIDELDPKGERGVLSAINRAALTSYYTPTGIAKVMNRFAELAGFKGGSMLDPSMGNGVFEGTMSKGVQQRTMIHGIELDWLTGQIARNLYPDANVLVTGYEQAGTADNAYDVVMSNIPFGSISVTDKTWKHDSSPVRKAAQGKIHNYFAVKMLDNTRPGGLCVIMTSNAILDTKGNQIIREHLADQAEVLGVVRLPDNTFKGAGTSVVTDVIFLRKYKDDADRAAIRGNEDYTANIEKPFLSSGELQLTNPTDGKTYKVTVNGYFTKNKGMMIGDAKAGGQYRADEFGLGSSLGTDELANAMSKIVEKKIVGDRKGKLFDTHKTEREVHQAVSEAYKGDGNFISSGNIVEQDGMFGIVTSNKNKYGDVTSTFNEMPSLKAKASRIRAMLPIREAMKELIAAEIGGTKEDVLKELRKKLQGAYDAYVKKFGHLNNKENDFLIEDIDGYTLRSLERWKDGKFDGLSDIFTKNTIKPALDLSTAKTPADAISLSLAEYGEINPSFMEDVLGESWAEQCGETLFRTPFTEDVFETADAYLSGDVKTKLEQAREAAKQDKSFERNVEALEAVQPKDIPFEDISIRMGARWIPAEVYTDFMFDMFGIRKNDWKGNKSGVEYMPEVDQYVVNVANNELGGEADAWRTSRRAASEVFTAALQDKSLSVFDTIKEDGKEIKVLNKEETELLNNKIQDLRTAFEDWLSQNPEREEMLMRLYNDKFNRTVLRKFDGSHLNVAGLMGKELRPHQKDAVWMLINNRGGIVDHIVGAGKTLVMQSAIMEMRRMGIAKKPMIIGLKATVAQIAKEFREAYPAARILAPTEKDFSKENRKRFMSQIALNDYDCVILSHDQYCMLPHTEEVERGVIDEQMMQLDAAIEYLYGQSDKNQLTKKQIKGLEKRKANLEAKLDKLLDRKIDREFTFEGLGVDYLFVDECQHFKSLPYVSTYDRVAGLGDKQGSQRAIALLNGVRYLQRMHQGDRGTVFLSGTTISNSLSEIYHLLNYLRPSEMERLGMTTFDAWAGNYAIHTAELEYGVTNELKEKDRFRSLTNIPELSKMYAEIADVRNDLNLKLPKPKMRSHVVTVPQSDIMQEINREIVNMVKNKDGSYFGIDSKDTTPWGLLASTLSAKAAINPRLIDDTLDDEGGKIPAVCENVKKIYDQFKEQKGTQLIFCDTGVPGKGKKYDAYSDIINRLVNDYGIPRKEIADIHEAGTDEKRKELFAKVNDGSVRILIGGTKNMGTGVNVQKRIVAMHHVDVPWTPADREQREGRGVRQGNEIARDFNDDNVDVYFYATEGSLDMYKYQLQETKGKLFAQFKSGTIGDRTFDEGDAEGDFDPAEVVAMLSGNPVIFEKSKQDKKVEKLRRAKRAYESDWQRRRSRYEELQQKKRNFERLLSLNASDVRDLERGGFTPDEEGKYPTTVTVSVKDDYSSRRTFDKPKEAGEYIHSLLKQGKKVQLTGFNQKANITVPITDAGLFGKPVAELDSYGGIKYTVEVSDDDTAAGVAFRNLLQKVYSNRKVYERNLEDVNNQLKGADPGENKFPKQAELDEALKEKKRLDDEYKKLSDEEPKADENKDGGLRFRDGEYDDDIEQDSTMQEDRDMMRSAVQQMGEKLHTDINIIEDVNEITHPNAAVQERRRKSKGWYDTATGQVNIVLDNNKNIDDVKASVGHETIAHKGLRELVGEENYDEFLDETYQHLRDDLKKGVDAAAGRAFIDDTTKNGKRAKSYEQHRRTAVDELFGRMAEKPFEEFSEGERTLWQKIKATVRRLLDKFLGSLKLPKWFELGDNELRYILWRSKERLERGKEHPIDLARDIVKREELGLTDEARYNMGDAPETFKARQRRAVENKGTVMPGLNDAQVKVVDVPRHPYTGSIKEASKQAIDAAKAKFVPNGEPKTLHYNNFGAEFDYSISGKALKESLNPKQQEKSDSRSVHLAVAEHLDEVIGASIEVEEHPDYLKNEHGERDTRKVNADALMHRFYGAITVEGKSYRVMTLMREDRNVGNGVHAYEVTKIEVLDGQTTKPLSVSSRKSNTPNDSHGLNSELEAHDLNGRSNVSDVFVSGAKLLNNLEKSYDSGKRILDESKIADESTDLYRDPDETEDIWNDQSLGLQERITAAATRLANNHRDNKTLRNDAMRAIGGNLSDLRKAMSLQRTFDMTTVKRVADLARVLMNNGYLNGLTQQEVKRLLAAVKNSVGHNDIEGDVQKVMDIMVDNQLKHAEDTLHELEAIRGSKVDARGVEVQGQLDPAGAHTMKVFKKTRGWEKTDIEEAISEAQQRMGSSDVAVADEAALEYTGLQLALEYAENIKDSKVEERKLREEIKQAHDDASERDRAIDSYRQYIASLQEAIRQNKIERAQSYFDLVGRLSDSLRDSIANAKDFKEAEKQRIREIQHNANSDMEGRPSDEHYKPTFADKFVNNSFVSFLFAPLATFDQMLRMFGGKSANGEGYLYNRFMRGWIDARQKEINGVRDKYAILDAKAAELFGGKVKTWGDLIRRVGKLPKGTVSFWNGGEMQEREMTQGNLMYIYMVNKMLDGRMKLRKMGITEENVADIEEVLDPRLIELADWLQDEFLVQTRNEYNETHKRMFGASMAAIEHYFPLKILANARADKPEDLDNPDKSDGISTATGSIIKRRRNALALDITGADALSVILDHVAQMEHWNAFAEFNRDINTLRTYKRFRNQVQNMTTIYGSGKELWKKFNDVCQMAAGTYRPPRTKLDEAAVNFAKGVTAAKVSFRMFTALKQFLSMPAYIPEARTDYLLRNIANPVGAWKWSMEHLPIFNERWRSRMSGDPRLLKSDMDWKMWRTRIMQLASRAGMSPNAFVDALTVSIGAHSMYQTRLAQYLRDGYSEADAEKKAVQDAEVLYNQTQQSSEGAFTSTMQVDRSWLSVLFTVFRNASMSYQRQLHDALRNFKHNLTPGGRARSIEFMTKQLLRDKGIEPQTDGNWSDADWQREDQVAKRKFRRQLLKDTLRVATFGYIMQFAWNLGAYLPYLLFGDDEDEKQKMWDDVWAHTAFGSVEGLTGGDLMSQAGQMMLTGEGNPAYLSKDMPLTSDIMAAFQKLGNGQHTEALNDMINLIVQAGLGVNPQSITDVALSIMDACGDDPALAHEATICISRILQVPQSQIDKMYFDEVGLSGDEVSKYSPAQLARRYAEYKVKRGRFLMPWQWDDEDRMEKETKKAMKAIKERMKKFDEPAVDDSYEEYEAIYKSVSSQVKAAKEAAKTDYVKSAKLWQEIQDDAQSYATYQVFGKLNTQLNKYTKMYLDAQTPEEAELCKKAIVDYKKTMVTALDAKDGDRLAESLEDIEKVMVEFNEKHQAMQAQNK